jgi:lysophospholipase L1-like esterase
MPRQQLVIECHRLGKMKSSSRSMLLIEHTRRIARYSLFAAIGLTVAFFSFAAAENSSQHWVATWSTSNAEVPDPATFKNQTVREIIHTSVGGQAVRILLANTFGTQAVTFDSVYVGLQKNGASLVPGSNLAVTFGGSKSITIREGAEALSDTISLSVGSEQNLSVSLFTSGSTGPATVHPVALQTNYISDAGNFASTEAASPFAKTTQSWYFLQSVDVLALFNVTGAIVALGDSITDGVSSRPEMYGRWADVLARHLLRNSSQSVMSVLNAGISGNRVLTSSPCWGVNALARLDRDVFSQTAVRAVILFEGTNDIGQPDTPTASLPPQIVPCLSNTQISPDDLIAGYKQIIAQAHARGLKIFGATILPYQGFSAWTQQGEAKRVAVNSWIKTSNSFDGVIDFASAIADPTNSQRMNPKYDSGDHLHPGPAGHEAMGNAVDLALFR